LNVLGICAISGTTVGLVKDGEEMEINVWGASTLRTLFAAVQDILKNASILLEQLDALCIVPGPGSFTGSRIAVTVAKAFYLTKRIPIFSVDTLTVLAVGAKEMPSPYLCPMIDAKKGKVFAAIYKSDPTLQRMTDTLLIEPSGVKTHIKGETLFFGDGARIHAESLKSMKEAVLAPPLFDKVRGVVVAKMGTLMLCRGQKGCRGEEISPIYLRDADVKRNGLLD
jgi:tRNA threonylcarbamoyladenosine biosynthesis protein TsaB